jgi:thioester reductase-like protein
MAEHIFMTGGTGLVGTNLIPRLLRAFPGSTITLLVRGDNDADVALRVSPAHGGGSGVSGVTS